MLDPLICMIAWLGISLTIENFHTFSLVDIVQDR